MLPDDRRAQKRAYYGEHRDDRRAYARDYARAHRPERRASLLVARSLARAVADGELARGCVDCGERDLQVLDFDHVRGAKRRDVSQMVAAGWSPAVVYAEIDKCEVRCANDHRRATARRRIATVIA